MNPEYSGELVFEIFYWELVPGVCRGVLTNSLTGERFRFESLPELVELLNRHIYCLPVEGE